MSSLLDRITNRLDRLRTPPAMAKRPARNATPEPTPKPAGESEPVTLAGLHTALDRLADERARQAAIISGAEADRDRVMDDADGDDAELLEIDRRVALARLALDRLARLEGEAFDALAPLELEERQKRWVQARDQYLTLMRSVHAAMEAYERAANNLWHYRGQLFGATGAPGWDDVVPKLPQFMKSIPSGNGYPGGFVLFDSHQYRAEAERLSKLMIGAPATTNNFVQRLTHYIEGKLDLDEVAPPSSVWGGGMENPADNPVLVRLSRKITLPDEVLAVGTVLKVRAAHARDLVAANRAELTDTLTTFAGQRPAGAELLVRELPLLPAPEAAA